MPGDRDETSMRSGSVSDLDFVRHPVPSIAVLAHWLVQQGASAEEAVNRLRDSHVGARDMRAAAELMAQSRQDDPALRTARQLLLRAAGEPLSSDE